MRLMFCLATLAILSGCARKTVRIPQNSGLLAVDNAFIDLEPGWRLRVITPLLKSGGYLPQAANEQTTGNTITYSAGGDFLGYETAYYQVARRGHSGVRIRFSSAAVTTDSGTTPQPRPVAPLFDLPQSARHVRLIYLQRASQADHNMALVASNQMSSLERLTGRVLLSPSACLTDRFDYCSWIPAGIAVRPEKSTVANGLKEWISAR